MIKREWNTEVARIWEAELDVTTYKCTSRKRSSLPQQTMTPLRNTVNRQSSLIIRPVGIPYLWACPFERPSNKSYCLCQSISTLDTTNPISRSLKLLPNARPRQTHKPSTPSSSVHLNKSIWFCYLSLSVWVVLFFGDWHRSWNKDSFLSSIDLGRFDGRKRESQLKR